MEVDDSCLLFRDRYWQVAHGRVSRGACCLSGCGGFGQCPISLCTYSVIFMGFKCMSHASKGVLTCVHIHSIGLDSDDGGAMSMLGGIL
ncbi:hypothetical protein DFH94DRAFT_195814 [Russula ochroleuca]|uniref:Uncharacterized protein n=1 Tax=Russula ochroleuca TaxID=152965 RepID=A0A9P5JZP0_9AGAM|nr:hypothetical protein DFH94DRAFT_195814 [Russula ochroleuca]